jgi:hypothetical protein
MFRVNSMSRFFVCLCVLGSMFMAAQTANAETIYYRYAFAPSVTCQAQSAYVSMFFDPTTMEWANIPGGATADITLLENGVETMNVSITLTAGTGSQNFAESEAVVPSYPYTLAQRYETIVSGEIVYTSTLIASCAADGPATVTLVNTVPSAQAEQNPTAFSGPALPTTRNLVVFIEDTAIYSAPDRGVTIGSIKACQTAFVLETSTDGKFGRVFVMGGWIPLSATVDVAEDYGQIGGQTRLPGCEGR